MSYLTRNWSRDFTGDSVITRASVKEMIRINNEYWSPRENGFPDLEEANVTTSIESHNMRISSSGKVISTSVGFKGGKLKLGRN
jgi:hypothetical protein